MIQPTPAFRKTLDALNPQQRQAVEGIHGPWMVLAGPGTGKTHMLAARIGNILLREDIQPGNILCLTFTNAGVKAMRDRLVRFIGVAGSRVAVHTFHDFARRVIEEHPDLFDYTDWVQMDELDRIRLVNRLIDGLPPKHPVRGPSYSPYTHNKDLLWLFNLMNQERWEPALVIAEAGAHAAGLEDDPEYQYKRKYKGFQKGDPHPGKVAEETERMERLIAGAELYDGYAELKRERGFYDYGDQLLWLRDALEAHETLRFILQEKYQFTLVDEFQDTNGLQIEILGLLAEEESPNLFVVGDDDQAIFEFQGARIASLRDHTERFAGGISLAVLAENYRSHQGILDAAQLVIEPNKSRLTQIQGRALDKVLVEGGRFDRRPRPRTVTYPNALVQAFEVGQQIRSWLAEGVPADEIAVIYRKHAQAERLLEVLEAEGLPYRLERSVNVLDLPLVRRLVDVLTFVGNLRADEPVDTKLAFEYLLCPAIGFTAMELFALNSYRFTDTQRVPSWRYLLTHPEVLSAEEVPIRDPRRFAVAAELLDELVTLTERVPLPTVVQQTIQRTGLLREAIAGEQRALSLEAIDQIVRDAGARARKDPALTLQGLCATWAELREYDLPLTLVKQADTRAAVSLMTAHSAKGLEFDCVILYDLTDSAWEGKRNGPSRAFKLPPELSRQTDYEVEESNRRLLYVALTRARKRLLLAVPEENDNGRPMSRASAVGMLLDEGSIDEATPGSTDEELQTLMEKIHQRTLPAPPPALDPAFAKTRWEDSPLTLGAAQEFERCKLGFYYQYVNETPRTERPKDRYRRTLHETLKEFYRYALHPEHLEFQSEEELVAVFTHLLNLERNGLSRTDYARYRAEGESCLRTWYGSQSDPLSLHVKIEQSISTTTAAGTPLRGRIDRIDVDPQTTLGIPVDYKFGKPKPFVAKRLTSDRRWRQLAYYAILMRDDMNGNVLPNRGRLVYLSPTGTEVVDVALDPGKVAEFEALLDERQQEILVAEDFSGCHEDPAATQRDKDNCPWCNFHYLKRDAEVLVSEEAMELDDV